MTEQHPISVADLQREHRRIWTVVTIVVGVLLVVMFTRWDYARDTAQAKAKAAELIQRYKDAGLPTSLDADQVAKVLGSDGGLICRIGTDKNLQGEIKSSVGVGGGFYFRASELDRNAVQGSLIIASVYCPDRVAGITKFIDSLDLSNVATS